MPTLNRVRHRTPGTLGPDATHDRLVDYVEMRELSAGYNRAVDDCRYENFANCFTPDGVFEVVGLTTMESRAAVPETVPGFGFGPVGLAPDATIQVGGHRATQVCTVMVCGRQRNRAAFRFLTPAATTICFSARRRMALRAADGGDGPRDHADCGPASRRRTSCRVP